MASNVHTIHSPPTGGPSAPGGPGAPRGPGAAARAGGSGTPSQEGTCLGRMWKNIRQNTPEAAKMWAVMAIKVATFIAAMLLAIGIWAGAEMVAGPIFGLFIGASACIGASVISKVVSDAAIKALGWERYIPFGCFC